MVLRCGRKPSGNPKTDAGLLAKFALEGEAKSMTELRGLGISELGDKRMRRALAELKARAEEYGVTCWQDNKTSRGLIGSESSVMQKRSDAGVTGPV